MIQPYNNEFQKLLRQIMSQEPKLKLSEKDFVQLIQEMKVFELVGDIHVVWLN